MWVRVQLVRVLFRVASQRQAGQAVAGQRGGAGGRDKERTGAKEHVRKGASELRIRHGTVCVRW